jgi:predicted secreted protein
MGVVGDRREDFTTGAAEEDPIVMSEDEPEKRAKGAVEIRSSRTGTHPTSHAIRAVAGLLLIAVPLLGAYRFQQARRAATEDSNTVEVVGLYTVRPSLSGFSTRDALCEEVLDPALARGFPEQQADVVAGIGFLRSKDGFTAKGPLASLKKSAVEAAEAALSDRMGLRLELPARGEGNARFSLRAGLALVVHERGAEGPGRKVKGAVVYSHSGGTSYWRATETGYEEWVLVAAAGERAVAEWEVQGALLQQEGDDVVVADTSGRARLRVTAPKAYGLGGQPVRAWLRVEGNVLALYTSARGPALIDPIWTTTGSMVTAREGQTATLLASGMVLVAGGVGPLSTGALGALSSAELYDPESGTWNATGSLATARYGHVATLLPSGEVLVAGGFGGPSPGVWLASAELYDPGTGTWRATGSLVSNRSGATATLLPSGKVLVAGGRNYFFPAHVQRTLSSSELYDPVTGTWSATGLMAARREGHSATLLPSGNVLAAGGLVISQDRMGFIFTAIVDSAELYDPVAATWSPTGSLATARYSDAVALLPSGKVLAAGGAHLSTSGTFSEYIASAELYDPDAGTWSATGSLASARAGAGVALLQSGRVLVAGGSGSDGILASAELYDPEALTWSSSDSMAMARLGPTATLLQSGMVLLAGGSGDGAVLGSAELFAPVVIAPTHVTLPPGASETFTVSGGSGTGYVWHFVTNASGGTLSATGLYTAGSLNDATDMVSVTDSNGVPATAIVTVTTLAVSPRNATVEPMGQVAFSVSGGIGMSYAWDFASNASGGTVTAAGDYEAGGIGGVTDVLRVTDSLGFSIQTVVVVTRALQISPSSQTVEPGALVNFTVMGGSQNAYVWDFVTNASGGTLSPAGDYQAGAVGGVTDIVRVTDSLGFSTTAELLVTLTLKVAPSNVTLHSGEHLTFKASGGSQTDYVWDFVTNASGANLSATGDYTAGATGAVADEVRVTDSLGFSATADVKISNATGCGATGGGAAPLLALLITPILWWRRKQAMCELGRLQPALEGPAEIWREKSPREESA